jgi:hypothetical protein
MNGMGLAVFMVAAVSLPTACAILSELNRRSGRICGARLARHRRVDALLSWFWTGFAASEWWTNGLTIVFWCSLYAAAACAWSWWRAGGDDTTRRTLDKGTGRVTRLGAKLVVVPTPA